MRSSQRSVIQQVEELHNSGTELIASGLYEAAVKALESACEIARSLAEPTHLKRADLAGTGRRDTVRRLGKDARNLAASLLDHRRHLSLVALSALYWHMYGGNAVS